MLPCQLSDGCGATLQEKAWEALKAAETKNGRLALSQFRRLKQLGTGDVGLVDMVELQDGTGRSGPSCLWFSHSCQQAPVKARQAHPLSLNPLAGCQHAWRNEGVTDMAQSLKRFCEALQETWKISKPLKCYLPGAGMR